MKIRRFAKHAVAGVLVLMSVASSPVMAQREHSHAAAAPASADQKAKASALVNVVRDATERFQDVAVAEEEGIPCNSAASADRTTARWACTS